MKHTVLFFLALLLAIGGIFRSAGAQEVVLNPGMTMVPNPSCYISDWQSNPQTIRLSVPMTEQCNYPVKLVAQAMLNGEVIARTNPAKCR